MSNQLVEPLSHFLPAISVLNRPSPCWAAVATESSLIRAPVRSPSYRVLT